MQEEIIDAESSTLSKNTSPLEHLRHLLKVGWNSGSPVIVKFVDKYNLHDELREMEKALKNKA